VGERDVFYASNGSFNVWEANLVPEPVNWYDWRVFLYQWGGGITLLSPQTDGGSYDFGAPKVALVNCPNGIGQCLWGSYMIFAQGAAPGEAGTVEFLQY
jgi:hypothetical protein